MEEFSRSRRLLRAALLASCLLSLPPAVQGAELLNGDFSQGAEHWKISFPAEAGADTAVSLDAADGKPALVLTMGESAVKPWRGRISQAVALDPGSYTLTFLARSEPENAAIELSAWDAVSRKSRIVGERRSFTVTPVWEEFLYTFLVAPPGTTVDIIFGNLARSAKTLSFSNIRLTKD